MKYFFRLCFLIALVIFHFNCKTVLPTKKVDTLYPDAELGYDINNNQDAMAKPKKNNKCFEKEPGWKQNLDEWKEKYGSGYNYSIVNDQLDQYEEQPLSQLDKPSDKMLHKLNFKCGHKKKLIDYSWFITSKGNYRLYGLCIEYIKPKKQQKQEFYKLKNSY